MENELLQSLGISEATEQKLRALWTTGGIRLDLPVIDLQHIWLVALIQEFAQAAGESGDAVDPDRLKHLLLEIIDFATEHFTLEEQLTNAFNYPEHTTHKQQHKHFIEFLRDRLSDIKQGNRDSIASLVNFLMDWLTMHIQKEDKQYRDYLVRTNSNLTKYFQTMISRHELTVDRAQAALYNAISGKSEVGEIISENILSNVIRIWNTHNLAVHIPIIDLQHLWLISMIVELDIASKTLGSTKRQKIFNKVVTGAILYTQEHFNTEERIMKKFGYKYLTGHIKQHQSFIEMVNNRKGEGSGDDPRAASHLVEDLKEWLVSHIGIEDRNIYVALKDNLTEVQAFVRDLINEGRLTVRKKQLDLYNEVCGIKKTG
ncbi:MAG: hemerythrin family protein [Spirochaetia bacterium]|nr:hemerythrin family protein [Spirochaetia bacterium]